MSKEKVGMYSEQVRGVSYKESDIHDSLNDQSVTLLRANNIFDNELNFDNVVYIDKSRVSDKQYLRKGDIVVCASSGSKNLVGKAAQVDFDTEVTFGAFLKVVRPKNIIPKYLGYYFLSNEYRRTISSISEGANINNIRNEHIDDLLISIVDNDTQKMQSEILDKVYGILKRKKQQLTEYDQLIKSRFVEMFGDPILNQKGWNSEKLQSVCPVNKYKGEVENISGKVWLLNLDMIESNTGKIIDYVYEDENKIASSTIKFDTNCVLYSKLRPYLNKVVVPSKSGYATSEMISMKTDNINKYFLSNLLMMNSFVDFANGTSYGAKMPRASVDMIKNFDLMLPPKSLQDDFGLFVEQVDKLKFVVQKSLDETQKLFDSLMQEYFG